ncbi:Hsd17b3, partial [Columba guinea]
VTGAGDGLGKAYSFELAKRGLNVVMISRTLEKLQRAASEVEQATGQKVKVIQADFTTNSVYENIEKSLQGLDIGVLVNNVGMLHNPLPCRFLNGPDIDEDLINCNIISVTKDPAHHFLQWDAHAPDDKNNFETNGAKAFISTFSKALQAEYKEKGIIIQVMLHLAIFAFILTNPSRKSEMPKSVVAPYGVSTPMTMYQKPGLITKTAEEFVSESLDYVTFGDEIFGCLAHEMLVIEFGSIGFYNPLPLYCFFFIILKACVLRFIPLWVLHSDRLQEAVLHAFTSYLKKRWRNP